MEIHLLKNVFWILSMDFSYSALDWLQALYSLHIVYLLSIQLPLDSLKIDCREFFHIVLLACQYISVIYCTCTPVLWKEPGVCFKLALGLFHSKKTNLLFKVASGPSINNNIVKMTIQCNLGCPGRSQTSTHGSVCQYRIYNTRSYHS